MTLPATPRNGAAPEERGVSLYVHWPFCVAKCPYCDFNSHVESFVDEAAWQAALLDELDHYAAVAGARTLRTVFFGGGTPSLMPPRIVGNLLERAARHWTVADDLETTLEANPSSAETSKLADFRAAGINRLSIGVQSFSDAELAFLGRAHDAAEGRRAVEAAARLFDRYSFDLIYALPGQQPEQWRERLRTALNLAGDHLSLYQLAIEKGTAFFAAHREGAFELPDDDDALGLMDATHAVTDAAGYPFYEVSNHAVPGGECRHNMLSWQGEDYAGIGPGAHGRIEVAGVRHATEQIPGPAAWLAAVRANGHGTRMRVPVDRASRLDELLITSLRLVSGVGRSAFLRATGEPLEARLDMEVVAALEQEGLVRLDDDALKATRAGMRCLDSLIAALAPTAPPEANTARTAG